MSVQESASTQLNFEPFCTKENSDFWERTKVSFAKIPLEKVKVKDEFLQKLVDILPSGTWVAGGAARSCFVPQVGAGDIDVYASSKEALISAYHAILQNFLDVSVTGSKYTITLRGSSLPIPVSLVKIAYFDDPQHSLDSFDFTVCQFAIDKENAYFNISGLEDVKNRKLNVHKFYKNQNPIQRINKYVRKGFELTEQSIIKTSEFFQKRPSALPLKTKLTSTAAWSQNVNSDVIRWDSLSSLTYTNTLRDVYLMVDADRYTSDQTEREIQNRADNIPSWGTE